MADTEDLSDLSTQAGNPCVNGVKVGEPFTGKADGNAELRLVETLLDVCLAADMRQRYTDLQLIEAVQHATSIRQVLAKLGLVEAGGNYSLVKRRIRDLKLTTSHFKGQGWRKGNRNPVVQPQPLHEILRRGTEFQSYKLKRRLFAEGLKMAQCESCLGTEWLGQPIPLELDHINGDATDNRIENLRILCPNCHALTATYRGKKLAKCRDETAPS
jgi:hypothetical protein